MKRKIYMYYCMDCDFEWESSSNNETSCPMCGCGDLHVEKDQEDENETRESN